MSPKTFPWGVKRLWLFATLAALANASALAIDIVVTSNADTGNGSLRQALQFNVALGGGNTILFSNSVISPITLTSGELPITTNVNIVGPGPNLLTVSGNNSSRIFRITNDVSVSITGLTIANGYNPAASGGGGILLSLGAVTIQNCTISNNFSANGGGILVFDGSLGLTDCTVANNGVSEIGAGIFLNTGTLALLNCTVAGNTATNSNSSAGGIYAGFNGTTALTNCTIYGNSASQGGGIRSQGGTGSPLVRNTIIAGNSASLGPDCYNTFISGGYNLIGKTDGSTGWGGVGDQLGTAVGPIIPGLRPLGMYAGPTPTMPPLYGGPVIDQGKNFGISVDQRGRIRTFTNSVPSIPFGGDHTDIGAVELGVGINLLVTNSNDSGPGSLRQAILDASPMETDIITFAPDVTNTITLTGGEIVLNKTLNITGPTNRALAVSGNNSSRVFHATGVTGGIPSPFIQSLVITRGMAPDYGGGILVDAGSCSLVNCQIVSNATAFFGSGGGILVRSNALVSLYTCSVTHNEASFSGGGVGVVQNGSVHIYSSTIASNRTTLLYEGIFTPYGGGIGMNGGQLYLWNSTIASNVSTYYGGGVISGLFTPGNTDIRSSIIAGNTSVSVGPDVAGSFNSGGYNLIGNSSGGTGFTNTGDQLNVNPLLGPLANYGGQTLMMALRSGSPAIDKGMSTYGIDTDQRGFPRPIDDAAIANASGGDGADIGAYEADSNFRIVDLQRNGNNVALSLMTVLGKNYRVEYTNNLPASSNWTVFTNNAPGNGWLLWVTNFGGANQSNRFYRGAIVP